MRFLNESKTRGRNIISSFLRKQGNLLHYSVVLELISFWIIRLDCLVRWFWVRVPKKPLCKWMKERKEDMGHAVHQFKALFWKNWLCRVRQPVSVWKWLKKGYFNFLISVRKTVSIDFVFWLQIGKDRLAANGPCFAFCHLIVENTSGEQHGFLVLKWLNRAMFPNLKMRQIS